MTEKKLSEKIHWQYYFARKFSLQRFQIVLNVFISDFWKEHFKVNVKNVLIKPGEGGNHEIWMNGDEFPLAQQKVASVIYHDLPSWYYYKRIIKQTQQRFLRGTRQLAAQVNPRISNKELAQLHQDFVHLHQEHFNKPIWLIFATEPLLAHQTEQVLKRVLQKANRMSEFDKWFEIIFSPDEKNAITRAREVTLELALLKSQGGLTKQTEKRGLEKIVKNFGWIPCYDVVDEPWGEDHFKEEVNFLVSTGSVAISKELSDLQYHFQHNQMSFKEFLKTFKLSKSQRDLFIIAHDVIFIKDERDDFRRQGSCLARSIFSEIGKRLGLTLKESAYLSIEEANEILLTSKGPSRAQIRERVRGYCLLRKQGRPLVIVSGQAMESLLRQELGQRLCSKTTVIKGTIGSGGYAKGTVAIVRTRHNLRQVSDGNIMVAITTNPDYVPAMRKCKAIVTDEGGITSHAAIVSREFRIPCIVGTKIATKVLKDGDLVEVDAKRGVVKKI